MFLENQSRLSKLYFKLRANKESSKTMVAIYKVICTEHCEYSLRIEAIECINNESLDWLGNMCTSGLYKF